MVSICRIVSKISLILHLSAAVIFPDSDGQYAPVYPLKSQQNPASLSDRPMTISQAAEFVNLTVPTLYGFVSKRTIPFSKVGKRLYFSEAELTAWIKSGRKKSFADLPTQPAVLVINKKTTR